ncbi:MAG: NAD-dependent succinate-semialdehyde dehydrogenase [Candidatus Thermochlorobacter aerophilum]|jgi:succinate-semialdehyde dehydrogenase/glutarate-semialdehyde dehydrogenase|uniref:NAD-dependent succinate-semialdehyde dehydrogenase n=1 Tax=Candidatus Thermochlorobacter aerophilus TaxID=1868324 RepID=A0A395LYE4_9BACT|nr:MAG: NAD-dependent succinate-semialdehyde dehydrogenase [Candidatus Thermochlorobacter aerophilum]
MLESINPATEERIQTYPEHTAAELDEIVRRAEQAFRSWKKVPIVERAHLLRKAAEVLLKNVEQYAACITQEMGKPIAQSRAEVEKCATNCIYFADNAERFLQAEHVATEAQKSYIAFEPLGVVLAIMPWNFPFWQVFRCAAPILAAGNTLVLKHAPTTTGCALAVQEVFRHAGFPEGVYQTLLIAAPNVPEQVSMLIEHPSVKAVTLTGSTNAGRFVAAKAGAALKKSVLELGGSDPYLILEDADLELAVETCANSRCINTGQSCIAAKRFIVVEKVRKKFEEAFVEKMRAKRIGDPLSDVDLGPLARNDLRHTLHRQVQASISKGAKLLLGGAYPEGKGFFYPPTVLSHVTKGMPAYDEELFGPVAAIIAAKDEAEAIALANDTCYGLGAAIFTSDCERGERIAKEIEAGNCFINAMVRSDPRLPFGGIKSSGYGRELSHIGMHEFVNIKTVFVR